MRVSSGAAHRRYSEQYKLGKRCQSVAVQKGAKRQVQHSIV